MAIKPEPVTLRPISVLVTTDDCKNEKTCVR